MKKQILGLAAILALGGGTAIAQDAAQDAQSILQAAAEHMGADNLSCISYTGNGYVGLIGQQYDHRDDWPRVELAEFSRTINYDAKSSHEIRVLRQGNYEPRGGGRQPILSDRRTNSFVVDNFAWNDQDGNIVPAPSDAELRQLDIWMTPHGFVRGAMAPGANPILITRHEGGALGGLNSVPQRTVHIISFMVMGKYRVNGTINEQNYVERIQTRIPNPVRGDLNWEAEFSQWRDFGGVQFPGLFHHHGDWDDETQAPNYNGGHNRLNVNVANAVPNDCGEALVATDAVRNATVPEPRVDTEMIADGVYYLTGGSHHSVAVEFDDYVTLIEAPQNEARALAVVAAVRATMPGKPIRYVVNTHHHFDHLAGLRTLFHEGAAIITHMTNYDFYKQEVLSHEPWTLAPDRLSLYPPTEFSEGYQFETVDMQHTVSDGTRILQLYYLQGTPHSEGMLIAYLPTEKILIEADVYSPPPPGVAVPNPPSAQNVNLYDNIMAYGLDVERFAPLHGRVVTWDDFLEYVDKDN
jgi:glyoxylase-like metal-dependent hydrolase (beta-lactamase superfamily II)